MDYIRLAHISERVHKEIECSLKLMTFGKTPLTFYGNFLMGSFDQGNCKESGYRF